MDATPNVEPLRQERVVGPRPTSRPMQQSAASVRHEIYSTLDDLHARVEELQKYIHSRFGSIDDPIHIREKIVERPMRACGIALVAGVVCGVMRAHRLPLIVARNALTLSSDIARGVSATFGSRIASDLVSRAMSSGWRASAE